MTCESRSLKGVTIIACSRGRKTPAKKKWVASVHDVHGAVLTHMKVQADSHEEAMDVALDQAKEIPCAFMVHIGLGERLVVR